MIKRNAGFVITTYRQVDLVRQNIERIRSYNVLGDSPIVVVSTYYEDIGIDTLNELPNVISYWYRGAPGNPEQDHHYKKPDFEFRNWRQEFLPPRILFSIGIGCNILAQQNVKYAVHLHSDSYWEPSAEQNLIGEILACENKMCRVEVAPNEYGNPDTTHGGWFAKPLHFHPESLIVNLEYCKKLKYKFALDFDTMWIDNNFKSNHWGGTEALLGQYAMYSLNGISPLTHNDPLPRYDEMVVRPARGYHGRFPNGFVNLPGEQ